MSEQLSLSVKYKDKTGQFVLPVSETEIAKKFSIEIKQGKEMVLADEEGEQYQSNDGLFDTIGNLDGCYSIIFQDKRKTSIRVDIRSSSSSASSSSSSSSSSSHSETKSTNTQALGSFTSDELQIATLLSVAVYQDDPVDFINHKRAKIIASLKKVVKAEHSTVTYLLGLESHQETTSIMVGEYVQVDLFMPFFNLVLICDIRRSPWNIAHFM
jgi:hypothetical protein